MKPGPETDLAVAKACGIVVQEIGGKLVRSKKLDAPGGWAFPDFQPSTDLNDAFVAAEKVGLFRSGLTLGFYKKCWRNDGGWWITPGCGPVDPPMFSTPALAICAAILKLAEGK